MMMHAKRHFQRTREFLQNDLWEQDLQALPWHRRGVFSLLRVSTIVIRGFIRDNCALQASALTYITLMSIVPVLAMAFAFAKGLGMDAKLQMALQQQLAALPAQVTAAIQNVFELVERTNFVTLGAIGSAFLFVTVIQVMGKIESTFNRIWGIQVDRVLMRKFADYISILVVVPVIILLGFTLTATLESETIYIKYIAPLGPAGIVVAVALRCVSAFGVIFAFSFLYAFMPNTKVNWRAALVAGVCAGISWIVWQWLCIRFQVILTRYNTIYGAFATLPITLFWLYTNWSIALFGAEISFAVQNYRTYLLETAANQMSFASRRRLAYLVMYDICRTFRAGHGPWLATRYQAEYGIPIRLILDVVHSLQSGGLIVETAGNGQVPARDTGLITLGDVEQALQGEPDQRTTMLSRRLGQELIELLGAREESHKKALAQTTFAELVLKKEREANG